MRASRAACQSQLDNEATIRMSKAAQFLATILIVAALVVPSRVKADVPKTMLAVPPDEIGQIVDESPRGVDLAGPSFGSWPILVVTSRGLEWLVESGFSFVVLDADLTRNLDALGPDMGDYHTYEETTDELLSLQLDYPELVEIETIGQSIEGREILAAIVSGAENPAEVLGTCLIVGLHHAREIITTEIVLFALNSLLIRYGNDPTITYLLDRRKVIFVPMLNPDGHVRVERGTDWRKNMRDNGDGTYGVDLNRNYSYMWGCDNWDHPA